MKTVLCYGDSNTWGAATVARPDGRYGPDERWPGVLSSQLGSGWLVIEEGLPGRTTVSDDPVEGLDRNGRTYLTPCLLSHRPLDLVVVMLGTNDLKIRFNKPASEIAAGVGALVDDIRMAGIGPGEGVGRDAGVPVILVIAPPPTRKNLKEWSDMFHGAPEKSRRLGQAYRRMAEDRNVHFLDAGGVVESSEMDGFHLDPEAHAALGRAVAEKIGEIFV